MVNRTSPARMVDEIPSWQRHCISRPLARTKI
jgi:hypothetical protein